MHSRSSYFFMNRYSNEYTFTLDTFVVRALMCESYFVNCLRTKKHVMFFNKGNGWGKMIHQGWGKMNHSFSYQ